MSVSSSVVAPRTTICVALGKNRPERELENCMKYSAIIVPIVEIVTVVVV